MATRATVTLAFAASLVVLLYGCPTNWQWPGGGFCDPRGESTECSDGNFCNGVETCSVLGHCVNNDPPDIDDHIQCTHDTCDPRDGVKHAPVPSCSQQRIESAFARHEPELDVEGDGVVDWHISWASPQDRFFSATLDRNHDGRPEAVWEQDERHERIALDRNSDGVYDLERVAEPVESGAALARIRFLLDTDHDNHVDQQIVETPNDGMTTVAISVDSNQDGTWDRTETYTREAALPQGWVPPETGAEPCDPEYQDQLSDIYTLEQEVVQKGMACLSPIDPAAAYLLQLKFNAVGTDFQCQKGASCAAVVPNRAPAIPSSYWPVPLIRIFQPKFLDASKCGSPSNTLFHELLHFIFPSPPQHADPGWVNDPMYGCATYCFDDARDVCAYKRCTGETTCPFDPAEKCNRCDHDTGECKPVDGGPCDLDFAAGPCRNEQKVCKAGSCAFVNRPDGEVCAIDSAAGQCRNEQKVCKGGACAFVNKPDGTTCEDDNLCSANDECRSGSCRGGPAVECQRQDDPCFEPFECRPDTGCLTVALPKPDGTRCSSADGEGQCIQGVCDPMCRDDADCEASQCERCTIVLTPDKQGLFCLSKCAVGEECQADGTCKRAQRRCRVDGDCERSQCETCQVDPGSGSRFCLSSCGADQGCCGDGVCSAACRACHSNADCDESKCEQCVVDLASESHLATCASRCGPDQICCGENVCDDNCECVDTFCGYGPYCSIFCDSYCCPGQGGYASAGVSMDGWSCSCRCDCVENPKASRRDRPGVWVCSC